MKLFPTALPGVIEAVPVRHRDPRGFFSETFRRDLWAAEGIDIDWVQDNHSFSVPPFVLRGLHFQRPPFAQAKLVRVARGRVFDVAVDIRRGSPHFGRWVGVELSAEKGNQLLVPVGFAHGLLTLEPDTEVLYKVSAVYSAAHDTAIHYADPDIGIAWPLDGEPVLSPKDAAAVRLSALDTGFVYAEAA